MTGSGTPRRTPPLGPARHADTRERPRPAATAMMAGCGGLSVLRDSSASSPWRCPAPSPRPPPWGWGGGGARQWGTAHPAGLSTRLVTLDPLCAQHAQRLRRLDRLHHVVHVVHHEQRGQRLRTRHATHSRLRRAAVCERRVASGTPHGQRRRSGGAPSPAALHGTIQECMHALARAHTHTEKTHRSCDALPARAAT
jgi:hypothetical protein